MYDNRPGRRFVRGVVRGAVLEVEPLGELEVQLDGRALEGSLQRVTDRDVNFGAVERAVAWIEIPFAWVFFVQGAAQLL